MNPVYEIFKKLNSLKGEENKMKYLIKNLGCDDTTETEIELTDDEFKAIRKFAIENNKNVGYQCQPEIAIFSTYTKDTNGRYDINWCDNLIKDMEE